MISSAATCQIILRTLNALAFINSCFILSVKWCQGKNSQKALIINIDNRFKIDKTLLSHRWAKINLLSLADSIELFLS